VSFIKYILFFTIITIFVSGCGKYDLENRINLANSIAKKGNLQKIDIDTDDFRLRGYLKNIANSEILKVYIEGDGFAWINRYTISPNPTPINPQALRFASWDKSDTVLYLARPCQYNITKNCTNKYWTDDRFSSIVIDNINQAITKIKKITNSKKIELIGFSGGGAIATIVASKRDDVIKIITIAGNLNHKLLSEYHHISYMKGSLNPVDIASKISNIPQIHYVGAKDKIIPIIIANSFLKASSNKKSIKINIIKDASHHKGWDILKGKI